MHSAEKNKTGDQDSDDEELSENEQKNLENILVLFPFRNQIENAQEVDDNTFERIKSALSCRICLEVYKDPVYTKDCMHRFCKQCIEKIIRSQQNKSCPFCRTPLGSKRVLRNDYITENIINKIFPDLKDYLGKEEEQDKLYYSSKIKELQEGTKGGRRKTKGGDSPTSTTYEPKKNILTPTGEEKRNKRKPPKTREDLGEEVGEKVRKQYKRKTPNTPEVNLAEETILNNNNKAAPQETITSKIEEEVPVVKSEPSTKAPENVTTSSAPIQQEIPLKKSQSSQEVINTKSEAISTKTEAKAEMANTKAEVINTKAEVIITKAEGIHPKAEVINTKTEAIHTKTEEGKEALHHPNINAEKLIEEVNKDETLMASLKHLMERADLNEIIMSLDFLTPVIIEPLPTEPYLKQLENPVVKTTSAIKVEQLAKFICKKLNLNEIKYNERIQVWIKKDGKYEIVDRQMNLKDIGNKYWSHLQRIDWEVYDLITHVEEYLNKTSKPVQSERVLYYSVYLEDWL